MDLNPQDTWDPARLNPITELEGGKAFRDMATPEAIPLAEAIDGFNHLVRDFNGLVPAHREHQQALLRDLIISSDAPATPQQGEHLPLRASHADGAVYAVEQQERWMSDSNARAVELIDGIGDSLENVGRTLQDWQNSRHGHQTDSDIAAFRTVLPSVSRAKTQVGQTIQFVNSMVRSLDAREADRLAQLPAPMQRERLSPPTPQYSPGPSPDQAAGALMSQAPAQRTRDSGLQPQSFPQGQGPQQRQWASGMRPRTYPENSGHSHNPNRHLGRK
jgi:hypothetical protein